jgi:nitroreductase
MNDLMQIIKGRRSIRKYEQKEVTEEAISKILEAVRWTPSWANTQCWEVISVRDRTLREKLQEAGVKGNPANKAIVEAPVLFALCGKLEASGYYKGQVTTKFGDWYMFDLGLATQTLCLVAHSLGLGTVIVGLIDHDKVKKILNVPDGYEVVALIPMGYPAQKPSAPKRREISEFMRYDTF